MPGVAFVVNGSLVHAGGHLVALCRQEAKRHGWDAELLVTEKAEAGVGAASGAALDGADLVVAVGGDGTVRGCAEGLARTGVPLGIVPHGTANLLARTLRIPGHPRAALAAALARRHRPENRPRGRRRRAVHRDGGDGARCRRRRGDQAQAPVRLARLRDVRGDAPRRYRPRGSPSRWTAGRPSSARPGPSWWATQACCPAASACCPARGSTTGCLTWGSSRRTGRSAGPGWPRGC